MSRPSSHPGAEVALVTVGGALGSLARWGLAEWLPSPAGTLVANVSGCFAIGVLYWLIGSSTRVDRGIATPAEADIVRSS